MQLALVFLIALVVSSVWTPQASPVDVPDEMQGLQNPSQPGEFEIETLLYGSGHDERRAEFRDLVSFTTLPVDATPTMDGVRGWNELRRQQYWGFGSDQFPINGRVWYPVGDGPFPLVLIVHGNYMMERASDIGFAYLGELLASRGFITASVDHNFLNGSLLRGMPHGEITTRGWLLLEHLSTWRQWNSMDSHPLQGKIDLSNIGLIGHSRGAEAIIVAAALNKHPHFPEDQSVIFDYDFGIRALISIARGDRAQAGGEPAVIEDISYLLLHGSHDGDQSTFAGIRQYQRVHFSDDRPNFKAAFYTYRANHNQFSTSMGTRDVSAPAPYRWLLPNFWLYRTKDLLTHNEQLQLSKTLVSAFLEATLRGKTEYRILFKQPHRFLGWLPDTTYTTRFQDEQFFVIADFEEDEDMTTTTLLGGRIETSNLQIWHEGVLTLRDLDRTPQQNRASYLGWDDPQARLAIRLPENGLQLGANDALQFSAAVAVEPPIDLDPDGIGINFGDLDLDDLDHVAQHGVDLTIELVSSSGARARLPLSELDIMEAPEPAYLYVGQSRDHRRFASPVEVVLQTYEIPFAVFVNRDAAFNPSDLTEIRFHFDRTSRGVIILDDIGLRLGD